MKIVYHDAHCDMSIWNCPQMITHETCTDWPKRDGYDGDFDLGIVLLIGIYCPEVFPKQLEN